MRLLTGFERSGKIGFRDQANGARQFPLRFVAPGLPDDIVGGKWRHAKALPQRRPQHALVAHVALQDHQHLAKSLGQHVEMADGGFFAVARRQDRIQHFSARTRSFDEIASVNSYNDRCFAASTMVSTSPSVMRFFSPT